MERETAQTSSVEDVLLKEQVGVYFSVADGRVSATIDSASFEHALTHALLFDAYIVVPDAFFFISPAIRNHIAASGGRTSLFEAGLKAGLIVPALRQEVDNFSDVVAYLRKGQGLGGIAPHEIDHLANRLDTVVPSLKTTGVATIWPEAVGASYKERLVGLLQVEEAPRLSTTGISDELWKDTAAYRYEGLNRAIELRACDGDVRRAEIINEVGRIAGVVRADEDASHATEVLDRMRSTYPSYYPKYKAMNAFLDWLDEIYRFNHADRLQVQPSVVNADHGTFALLSAAYHGRNAGPVRVDQFTVRSEIPSFNNLKRLDSTQLLSLREKGSVEWAARLKAFVDARTPDERWRAQVGAEQALENYFGEMRKAMPRSALQSVDVQVASGVAAVGLAAVAASTDLLLLTLEAPAIASYIATVLSGGYVLTRMVGAVRREKVVKTITNTRELNSVTLPDPDQTPA